MALLPEGTSFYDQQLPYVRSNGQNIPAGEVTGNATEQFGNKLTQASLLALKDVRETQARKEADQAVNDREFTEQKWYAAAKNRAIGGYAFDENYQPVIDPTTGAKVPFSDYVHKHLDEGFQSDQYKMDSDVAQDSYRQKIRPHMTLMTHQAFVDETNQKMDFIKQTDVQSRKTLGTQLITNPSVENFQEYTRRLEQSNLESLSTMGEDYYNQNRILNDHDMTMSYLSGVEQQFKNPKSPAGMSALAYKQKLANDLDILVNGEQSKLLPSPTEEGGPGQKPKSGAIPHGSVPPGTYRSFTQVAGIPGMEKAETMLGHMRKEIGNDIPNTLDSSLQNSFSAISDGHPERVTYDAYKTDLATTKALVAAGKMSQDDADSFLVKKAALVWFASKINTQDPANNEDSIYGANWKTKARYLQDKDLNEAAHEAYLKLNPGGKTEEGSTEELWIKTKFGAMRDKWVEDYKKDPAGVNARVDRYGSSGIPSGMAMASDWVHFKNTDGTPNYNALSSPVPIDAKGTTKDPKELMRRQFEKNNAQQIAAGVHDGDQKLLTKDQLDDIVPMFKTTKDNQSVSGFINDLKSIEDGKYFPQVMHQLVTDGKVHPGWEALADIPDRRVRDILIPALSVPKDEKALEAEQNSIDKMYVDLKTKGGSPLNEKLTAIAGMDYGSTAWEDHLNKLRNMMGTYAMRVKGNGTMVQGFNTSQADLLDSKYYFIHDSIGSYPRGQPKVIAVPIYRGAAHYTKEDAAKLEERLKGDKFQSYDVDPPVDKNGKVLVKPADMPYYKADLRSKSVPSITKDGQSVQFLYYKGDDNGKPALTSVTVGGQPLRIPVRMYIDGNGK
jgi:hypothetical protein